MGNIYKLTRGAAAGAALGAIGGEATVDYI